MWKSSHVHRLLVSKLLFVKRLILLYVSILVVTDSTVRKLLYDLLGQYL